MSNLDTINEEEWLELLGHCKIQTYVRVEDFCVNFGEHEGYELFAWCVALDGYGEPFSCSLTYHMVVGEYDRVLEFSEKLTPGSWHKLSESLYALSDGSCSFIEAKTERLEEKQSRCLDAVLSSDDCQPVSIGKRVPDVIRESALAISNTLFGSVDSDRRREKVIRYCPKPGNSWYSVDVEGEEHETANIVVERALGLILPFCSRAAQVRSVLLSISTNSICLEEILVIHEGLNSAIGDLMTDSEVMVRVSASTKRDRCHVELSVGT